MKTTTFESAQSIGRHTRRSRTFAEQAVRQLLEQFQTDAFEMTLGGKAECFGPADPVLTASVEIRDPAVFKKLLTRGSLGAAESFMDGDWTTNDLTTVLRVFLRQLSVYEGLDRRASKFFQPLLRLLHWTRRNTRRGSRRNIHEHYDLGNDFFKLMLDDTMTYSCGIFAPGDTLKQASLRKYARIAHKLNIQPGDHILEIGTGWGGFARYAAEVCGARVTTTTISKNQYEYARALFESRGLSPQIELLNLDYRELKGEYDKIVSIEMIEAVGEKFYETYFETCARCLKPEGSALIQAILIEDQRYEKSLRSIDFIQKYIFPGSNIPSFNRLSEASTQGSDLRLFHFEDITEHYAETLRHWRKNFLGQLDAVRELGYPDRFIRMWDYYLCYCEAGFTERKITDAHLLFSKPKFRGPAILPELGERLE